MPLALMLRISGAVGDHASLINGDWQLDPSTDNSYTRDAASSSTTLELLYLANDLRWEIYKQGDDNALARYTCLRPDLIGAVALGGSSYKWVIRLGQYRDEKSYIKQTEMSVAVIVGNPLFEAPARELVDDIPSDLPDLVDISGDNYRLNGLYFREDTTGTSPIYINDADATMCIEYSRLSKQWLIHDSASRGSDSYALAVLPGSGIKSRDRVRATHGEGLQEDRGVKMTACAGQKAIELKAEIDQKKVLAERNLEESRLNLAETILITGVTGGAADAVNGRFVPSISDSSLYWQQNYKNDIHERQHRIKYNAKEKQWQWSLSPGVCIAYLPSPDMSVREDTSTVGRYDEVPMSVHRLPIELLMIREGATVANITKESPFVSQTPNIHIDHGDHIEALSSDSFCDSCCKACDPLCRLCNPVCKCIQSGCKCIYCICWPCIEWEKWLREHQCLAACIRAGCDNPLVKCCFHATRHRY